MEKFEIYITYGIKPFTLKCVKEYESAQIMRIRVHGKTNSILLQNNYPLLKKGNSKKAISWKLMEGSFVSGDRQKDARLLADILSKLEDFIKGKNPNGFLDYLRNKK